MESENSIPNVYICAMGMITAVGDSAPMTAASVRAGINRFREIDITTKLGAPMKLALLPDDALPKAHKRLARAKRLNIAQTRMLCMAGAALKETLDMSGIENPPPLFLAVSEDLPTVSGRVADNFLDDLFLQSGGDFDNEHSRLFRTGRAGGLIALEAAVVALTQGQHECVLAGGVDSYDNYTVLDALDQEDRLLSDGVMDGFVPGEGAGILLLATEQAVEAYGLSPLGVIGLPGITVESGHRYSEQPYRGDGLAEAFTHAFENCPEHIIQTIFASLNGENFGAKEYGVAVLRNKEHLAADFRLEHPADCFGDIGAAFAPVLTGIACIGMNKGYIEGPVLVYCSSDGEWRGAFCVDTYAT